MASVGAKNHKLRIGAKEQICESQEWIDMTCRSDPYGGITSRTHRGSSLWWIAMIETVSVRLVMSCTEC